MLVAMVRSFTWPEVLAEVQAQPSPQAGRETLHSWVATAAPQTTIDSACARGNWVVS